MAERKYFGDPLTDDPDDAPELLEAFFEDAEIRIGEKVIRPALEDRIDGAAAKPSRGRPRRDAPKEQTSIRLDPDLLARLRETGPGWQSRANALLRHALGMDGKATPT